MFIKRFGSFLKAWIMPIFTAVIIVLFVRSCAFELATVPSGSMEGTLLVGDFVLINKLAYGPRLPFTPLSIPFLHKYLPYSDSWKSYSDAWQWPYLRGWSYDTIHRGDIVVFNYPMEDDYPVDHRTFYVKRCVGLPGDSLRIDGNELFVNGKKQAAPLNVQYHYLVKTSVEGLTNDQLEKCDITEKMRRMDKKDPYNVFVKPAIADSLKVMPQVLEVDRFIYKKGTDAQYFFPQEMDHGWNAHYYGPLRVPKKGDKIKLSTSSLPLYSRIITEYEKNDLAVRHDSIFVNGRYASEYELKMNYYFMLGDNRDDSEDSRLWGFLPEDHIVGRVSFVLLSVDRIGEKTGIRWSRFFKTISSEQ